MEFNKQKNCLRETHFFNIPWNNMCKMFINEPHNVFLFSFLIINSNFVIGLFFGSELLSSYLIVLRSQVFRFVTLICHRSILIGLSAERWIFNGFWLSWVVFLIWFFAFKNPGESFYNSKGVRTLIFGPTLP